MKRLIAYGIGLALLSASTGRAEPIPLDQIWAYEMPGTKDVRELEPLPNVRDPSFDEAYSRSMIVKIARHLAIYVPERNEKAGPAFVVVGTDKEALKNTYTAFKEDEPTTLPKDTELSLVFFSYATGWHPKINSVERTQDSITVKYQFVAPEEPAFGAVRFALIPIGKLPKGTVKVEIEQVPPVDYAGRRVLPKKDADRFVCHSFSFDVR